MARPRKIRSPSEERAWQARRAEHSRLRAAAAREQRRAQDPDYHAREAARMRRRRQDRQVREEETKGQRQRRADGSWEHEADAKWRRRRDLPDVVPSTVVTAECHRASLDIPSGCIDDPVSDTDSPPVPRQDPVPHQDPVSHQDPVPQQDQPSIKQEPSVPPSSQTEKDPSSGNHFSCSDSSRVFARLASLLLFTGDRATPLAKTTCLLKATEEILFRCCFCTHIDTHPRGITSHLVAHGDEELSKGQHFPLPFGFLSRQHSLVQIHRADSHVNCLNFPLRKHHCLNSELKPSEERPYKCQQCPKAYKAHCSLTYHIRTHSGEKPFKCKQCPKAFTRRFRLTEHIRTHLNEKPFKCKHCSKAFTVNRSLTVHSLMHKYGGPYRCELCRKTFFRAGELTYHIQKHTGEKPHRCQHCPKAFATSSNLKYHIQTHTGEKPYRCEHCSAAFAASGTLKNHIRIHTGEKPYKCEHCPKAFTVKSALKCHIRTHR